jgi:putative methyltransferase (TIGR04325 family)
MASDSIDKSTPEPLLTQREQRRKPTPKLIDSAGQTSADCSSRHGQRDRCTVGRVVRSLWASPVTQALLLSTEEWVPPLRMLHERVYEREFAKVIPWARRFRGVYASFNEAERAAPATKPVGYDNPAAAKFMEPWGNLLPSDYPVLFWMQRALQESPSLLDIGGYVGISYYSYRRYLNYPDNIDWIIQDVPAVVAAGVEIARHQHSPGLSFTADITSALRPQTVLAAGSLQFIEKAFAGLLLQMGSLPTHLIVNKTPLTDLPDFVTLQDLGPAVCPYKILNRTKFIDSIKALGYELVDSWANTDLSCGIPFHLAHSVKSYSGLYFKLSR